MARVSGHLPHRFAEMLVVVGIDESSGVRIRRDRKLSQPDICKEYDPNDVILEPQLLAAVSSRLAIYPFREPAQDRKYPPMSDVAFVSNRKQSVTEKRSRFLFGRKDKSQDRKPSVGDTLETPGKLTRRLSRRMSFIQHQDKVDGKAGGMLSVEAEDLAVPYDVLSSLCGLCFPDDEKISSVQLPSKIHHLVLTDMAGNRSHATCLSYWSPYSLKKSEKGDGSIWECSQCSPEEADCVDQNYGWLPACLVLISKFPYYTLFKDCLSKLHGKMSRMPKEQYFGLKEMALQLTMTPVPPAGQVNISLLLDDTHFIIFPPESPYRPVVDLPLELIFTKFSPDQVQKLVLSVLTQQRIVFVSKVCCLLTTIMETLLLMAHPFDWKLPYVPVLPKSILELLDAPGTFIMGCHASHKDVVSQIEGLVIADIDEGTVTLGAGVELPIMPVEPSSAFLHACEEFIHPSNQDLERLTFFKYEDMKAAEVKVRDLSNQKILRASLQLMVHLFRPLLPFIRVEQRFFKKDQFIQSISEEFQLFYIQVLQTDLFGQFLKDRFANVKDAWTALEERTRPSVRRSLHSYSSEYDLIMSPLKRRSSSALSLSSAMPSSPIALSPSALSLSSMSFILEPVTVVLPVFSPPLHKLYYTKCIDALHKVIEESKTTSVRASCLHLTAMLHFANKKPLEALEYFNYIHAYDSRLFPKSLVSSIIRGMTESERLDLQKTEFYNQSDDLKHLFEGAPAQRDCDRERPIIMHIDKLPNTDLDFYNFSEKCQIHEIATDHETIKRLFEALALGLSKQKVDSATFVSLYEGWKEIEMERRGCIHNVNLDEGEYLLKVSSIIKTSMGTGRLALTQKRLFFLVEGSKNSKNVARLTDIKDVDRISVSSFLSQAPGIKISYKDSPKSFVATLKDQRDMWHMVIVEMWSGKLISDELRDISIIHQASQNVTLIDTLLRSGEEEQAQHHDLRTQSAEHMCYFTQRRLQGMDRLPDETKDILQRRIDPNLWEAGRSAIEALLYIPGNRSSNVDDYIGPKLWCGFGSGKIQVYDASTWDVETKFVQAKERIVCMIAVGNNQVWAGSLDTNIYVINIDTHTCYQTLARHSAMVTDMIFIKEERYVVSTDVAGVILIWNIDTVQAIHTFSLPDKVTVRSLHFHARKLWCCCKEEIIAVDLNGSILHRINPSPGKKFSSPLDCLVITDKELWVGCGREGQILIWDARTLEMQEGITLQCQGISKMLLLQGRVWAATKDGMIFIINIHLHDTHRLLHGHTDAIRSICCAQTRYVLSGAGSRDGKIAIWKTNV